MRSPGGRKKILIKIAFGRRNHVEKLCNAPYNIRRGSDGMWIGVIYQGMKRTDIDVIAGHFKDGRDGSCDRRLLCDSDEIDQAEVCWLLELLE